MIETGIYHEALIALVTFLFVLTLWNICSLCSYINKEAFFPSGYSQRMQFFKLLIAIKAV